MIVSMLRTAITLLLGLWFATTVYAAASTVAPDARPKIGLALSGGGARGFAHVGALKALEELHIPVDYVAGTSMGSIIGGLYALGTSPEALEQKVLNIDWQRIFIDGSQRDQLSLRNKQQQRRYFMNLEFGVNPSGSIGNPTGAIGDQELLLILKRLTGSYRATQFSDLIIPFKAVATDINKAETFILDHGDLALALRASMAVPFVFSPVEWQGRVLVDGGILNNLPVDVVKAMGADIVIAINITSPLQTVQANSSLLNIAQQSMNTALIQNTRKALQQADLVISPSLDPYTSEQFTEAKAIMAQGYQEVMRQKAQLQHLAMDPQRYAARLKLQHRTIHDQPITAKFVEFSGQKRTSQEVLQGQVGKLDTTASTEDVEKATRRLMALNEFSRINYSPIQDALGQPGLLFEVQEKPWGPHYFRFGVNSSSNAGRDEQFQFLLKHEWLNVNRLGAEWHNELITGTNFIVNTEFYQPLDAARHFFVAPYFSYTDIEQPIFVNRHAIATYSLQRTLVGADIGLNINNTGELRLGIVTSHGDKKLRVGDPSLPNFSINDTAIKLRWLYDSLDDLNFARSGHITNAFTLIYPKSWNKDADYQHSEIYARQHFSLFKQHSLFIDARAQALTGNRIPAHETILVGSFNDFSGFRFGELEGRYTFISRIGAMYALDSRHPLGFAGDWKFLASAHAGNVWNDRKDISLRRPKTGVTSAIVWDTAFGIVMLGAGFTEGGDVQYYLSVGNLFNNSAQ